MVKIYAHMQRTGFHGFEGLHGNRHYGAQESGFRGGSSVEKRVDRVMVHA
jgi:hypothetical protein